MSSKSEAGKRDGRGGRWRARQVICNAALAAATVLAARPAFAASGEAAALAGAGVNRTGVGAGGDLVLMDLSAFTQSQWTAPGGGDWNIAANWSNGAPLGPDKFAVFGTVGGNAVINGAAFTVGGMSFDNAVNSFTISAAGITLDTPGAGVNALVAVANGSHTITSPLTLNKPLDIDLLGTSRLTMSGTIGGAGAAITKTGDGTLQMTAATPFAGQLTVAAGTLQATTAQMPTNVVNDGTVLFTGTGAAYGGTVAGSGGLLFQSPTNRTSLNTFSFGAAHAYGGATTLPNAGMRLFGAAGAATGSSAFVLTRGGLTLDNATAVNNDRVGDAAAVQLAGSLLALSGNATADVVEQVGAIGVGAGGSSTITLTAPGSFGTTLSAASFTRDAGGVLLVRGALLGQNNATGVTGANLRFTAVPALSGAGAAGSSTVGVMPGVVADISAAGNGEQATLATYGVNGVRQLAAAEYSSTFAANANVAPAAAADVDALNVNAIEFGGAGNLAPTAGQDVNIAPAGRLAINSGMILSNATSGSTFNGGTLAFGPGAPGEAIVINYGAGAITINSSIDATSLTKAGNGTLTLGPSATATFTGTTHVNQGVLRARGNNQLGTGVVVGHGGHAAVQTSAGFLGGSLQLSDDVTYDLPLTINGAHVAGVNNQNTAALHNAGGNNTWAGDIALAGPDQNLGNWYYNSIGGSAGTLTLSGVLSGTGAAFQKLGNATLVLTGDSPNTFTGVMRPQAGTIVVEKNGAFGPATAQTALGTLMTAGVGASTATIAFRAPASSPGGFTYSNFEWIGLAGTGAAGDGVMLANLGGANTFAGGVAFGSNVTSPYGGGTSKVDVAAGSSLNLTGPLAARAAAAQVVVKQGGGNLIVSGAAPGTLPGSFFAFAAGSQLVVDGGAVTLRGATATTGTLAPGFTQVTLNTGGTLTLDNTLATANRIPGVTSIVAGGGEINLLGADHTFAGTLGGAGALLVSGNATLTLAGTTANTNAGTTTVNSGTLRLAKPAGVNAVGGGVTVNDSATLLWANNEQIPNNGTLTLNAGGTINLAGFTETVAGFLDNGGTTVLGGGGTLNVTGDLTLTDGTTIAAGTTIAGHVTYTGTTTAATISGPLTLTGTAAHDFDIANGAAAADVVVSGTLSSTAAINKRGAGLLELAGGGAVGDLNVHAGTLRQSAGTLATAQLAVNGGGVLEIAGGAIAPAHHVYLGSSLGAARVDHSAGSLIMSGPEWTEMTVGYGGAATYDLGGTGVVDLGARALSVGAGAHAGTFNQTGGTLTAGPLNVAGTSGSGTFTMTGGAASVAFANIGSLPGVEGGAGGAGVLNIGGSSAFTTVGALKIWDTPGTAVNLSGGSISAGSLDFSGNASRFNWTGGALNLTASNLTIAAAGPFGANLAVGGGKFITAVNHAAVVGDAAAGGATLAINSGGGAQFGALVVGGAASTSGTFTVDGAASAATTVTLAQDGAATMNLSNGGSIGSETATLAGGATGTATTTIGSGSIWNNTGAMHVGGSSSAAGGTATIAVGANGLLDVGAALHLWPGGTLNVGTGGAASVGALSGSGAITVQGALAVGKANTSSTYAGTIGGKAGTLTKTGAGTLTLAGASAATNTGVTTVAGGTLVLAKPSGVNALGGDVTVNAGALLWAASEQLDDAAVLTLNAGGTINLAGFTETVGAFIDNGGTTVLAGGTLNVTPGGDIALTDGTHIAAATVLGGNLTYSGTTTAAQISGNLTLNAGPVHTFDIADGAAATDVLLSGAIGGGPGQHVTKAGAGTIELGGGGSIGNVTVNAGTLAITAGNLTTGDFFVDGTGGAVSQSGGTLAPAGTFVVGESGSGSYTLSAGTLRNGTAYLGSGGAGTFNQSGGLHSVVSLIMTNAPTATAAYNLTGGTLAVAGGVAMGGPGTATFTQAGGAAVVEQDLAIGNGAYAISEGTLQAKGKLIIGWPYPNGTFTQTGGTVTVGPTVGDLEIGGHANGGGAYQMDGGTLAVTGSAAVGIVNSGAFNQTGGTSTIAGDLVLGFQTGSSGTYTIGGAGAVSAANIFVGGTSSVGGGAGAFTINAGTVTAAGVTKVYNTAGSVLNLAGGILNTGSLVTEDPADFNWTGGTLRLTNSDLEVSSAGPLGAGVTVSGSKVLYVPNNALRVGGASSAGTFALSGGLTEVQSADVGGDGAGVVNLSSGGGASTARFETTGHTFLGRTAAGAGTINISGDGSSAFYVNNGAMYVGGSAAAAGGTGAVNITSAGGQLNMGGLLHLWGGGQLNVTGGTAFLHSLSGSAGSAITNNGRIDVRSDGTNTTYAGSIGGSGAFNKLWNGSLAFTGPQNWTSGSSVYVGEGTLRWDVNPGPGLSNLSADTGGTVFVNGIAFNPGAIAFDGGTLRAAGTAASSASAMTLAAGGVAINLPASADRLDYTGAIGGAGGVTKSGAGTLALGGAAANTFAGATAVTGGTLLLNKPAGVNAIAGDVSVNATGTLRWLANEQIADSATLTLNTGGTLDLNGRTETVGSFIDKGGSIVLGGGTLNVVDGGDIVLTDGTVLAAAVNAHGNVFYNGTTTAATISGDLAFSSINAFHFVEVADGAAAPDVLVSGAISGAVSMVKTGAGTLRLTGANTLSGALYVDGGLLEITAGSNAPVGLIVGSTLSGSLTQSGGTVTLADALFVGAGGTNVAGAYALSAGSLSAVTEYVGSGTTATGTFTHAGGTNTVAQGLIIGQAGGSNGSYVLSGAATLSANHVFVGAAGAGTFLQSGGTVSGTGTNSTLRLGNAATGVGHYTLGAGDITVQWASVGYDGSGTFKQTGGTNNVTTALFLADRTGSFGRYQLDDGTLATGDTHVGHRAAATFVQSGGTHTVAGNLRVGSLAGGNGRYDLAGGQLNVNGSFIDVADAGTGTFNHQGGTLSAANSLSIAFAAGSNGTYNLSGGAVNVGGTLRVGSTGQGTFVQTGGTVSAGGQLLLGSFDGTGTYALQAGSITTGNQLAVGWGSGRPTGAGTFTQSAGTSITIGQNFNIGGNGSSTIATTAHGHYNMLGGEITLPLDNAVMALGNGLNATGTLTQSGGTISLNGATAMLDVGRNGGTGVYNLTGAAAALKTRRTRVGGQPNSTGVFVQSGGAHTVAGNLFIADQAGSAGRYELSAGTINTAWLDFGAAGAGTFAQTGGSVTVTNGLWLGTYASGTGTFAMSGGSMHNGFVIIGNEGAGTFNQTGGTYTTPENINLASLAGSSGTYTIGGAGTPTATALNIFVGGHNVNPGGAGVFTVNTGGAVTATGTVKVWETAGSAVNVAGGTLTAGTLDVARTFAQSGGGAVAAQRMFLNGGAGRTASFSASGAGTTLGVDHPTSGGVEGINGTWGSKTFSVLAGAKVRTQRASGWIVIEGGASDTVDVVVDGAGSELSTAAAPFAFNGGDASMTVSNGGALLTRGGEFWAANQPQSHVDIRVTGAGSLLHQDSNYPSTVGGGTNSTATLLVDNGGRAEMSNVLFGAIGQGSAQVTVTGTGSSMQLNDAEFQNGNLTVTAGAALTASNLAIGGSFAAQGASPGTATIGAGATASVAGTTRLWAGSTLQLEGAFSTNALAGAGTLKKVGPGVTQFTAAAAANNAGFTGPVQVLGGTLRINRAGALGPNQGTSIAPVTLDGGTLENTDTGLGASFLFADRSIVLGAGGGTVSVATAGNVLYFGQSGGQGTGAVATITGAGATLTKDGPGEFRLTGPGMASHDFAKLVVNNGLYRLGTNGVAPIVSDERAFGAVPAAFMSDQITLNGGSIGATLTTTLHPNRGITVTAAGGGFISTPAVAGAFAFTVPGVISGPGGVTVNGAGATVFAGANTYAGETRIGKPNTNATQRGGTLRIGATDALPVTTVLSFDTSAAAADPLIFSTLDLAADDAAAYDQTVAGIAVAAGPASQAHVTNSAATARRTFTVNNAAANTWAGNITGNLNLRHSGTGALVLAGTGNTYTGSTINDAGTLRVAAAGAIGSGPLQNDGVVELHADAAVGPLDGTGHTVVGAAAGAVTVTAGRFRQASLTVNAGATAAVTANGADGGVSDVSALALAGATGAWTAKLDLADNDLIVRHGNGLGAATLALLTDQVRSGLNAASGSLWSGNGITSSTAAQDPGHYMAIGIYGNGAGAVTSFGGIAVDPDVVLLKYTKFGDANFDEVLSAEDLALLDHSLVTGGQTGWQNGDFNYDGVIDRDNDYAIWIDSFYAHGYQLTPEISAAMARIESLTVPEPTGATVIAAAAAFGMLGRRVRRGERGRRASRREPSHGPPQTAAATGAGDAETARVQQ